MEDSDILNSPLEDFDTLDFSTLRRKSNADDETKPKPDALGPARGRSHNRSIHKPGFEKNVKKINDEDEDDKETYEPMEEGNRQDGAEADDIEEILKEDEDLPQYGPNDKLDVVGAGYGSNELLGDHGSAEEDIENDVDIISGDLWPQMFTVTEDEEAPTSASVLGLHPSPTQIIPQPLFDEQSANDSSMDESPNQPANDSSLSCPADNPTDWTPPRINYASVLSEEYQAIARAHQPGLSDSRPRPPHLTLDPVLQKPLEPLAEQEQPASDVTLLRSSIWSSPSLNRRVSDNIPLSSMAAPPQPQPSSPCHEAIADTHLHSPIDRAAVTVSDHRFSSETVADTDGQSTWQGNPSLQQPQGLSAPVNENPNSSPLKSPPLPPSSSPIKHPRQYPGSCDTGQMLDEGRRSSSPLTQFPDQLSRQTSPSRPGLPSFHPVRFSSSIADLNSASRQAGNTPQLRRSLSPQKKALALETWMTNHRSSSPIATERETITDASEESDKSDDNEVKQIKQEEGEIEDRTKSGNNMLASEEHAPEHRPSDDLSSTNKKVVDGYAHNTRNRKALSAFSFISLFLFITGLVVPPREFPMPDLIKLSNLALSFEPLIYYSGNEIQQINVLNNMGAAVWDLGYTVKISDMAEAPSIAVELSDLSDSLTSLSHSLTKFFTGINSDVDSTLLVVDWARRQLQPLTHNDDETNFVVKMFRNLHEFTAHLLSPGSAGGGIESLFTVTSQKDGSTLPRRSDRYLGLTPAGRKLFYILGPTETQRADTILVWVFREVFAVLEKAIVEELTTASGLFVLFDTIDRHFDNIAHLTTREKDTLEQGQNELLGSLWARVLGKRAWRIHKFESNKQLLSEVRNNIVSNKQKLLQCHGKLLASKLSLEALRKRLSPPLLNHDVQSNMGNLVKHSMRDETYHVNVPSTSTVSFDPPGSNHGPPEVLRETHASFISTSSSYSFIADLNAQIRGLGSTYNYLKGARDRHKEALWDFVYGTRQEPVGPFGMENDGWR